jgi:hypothetical protein
MVVPLARWVQQRSTWGVELSRATCQIADDRASSGAPLSDQSWLSIRTISFFTMSRATFEAAAQYARGRLDMHPHRRSVRGRRLAIDRGRRSTLFPQLDRTPDRQRATGQILKVRRFGPLW